MAGLDNIRIAAHLESIIVLSLILLILSAGCRGKREERRKPEAHGDVAELVDDTAVIWLDAPAFSALSLNDRIAAYYLTRAILAGRDIAYDQIHPRQVDIRRFCEDIARNVSYGARQQAVDDFWVFLKKIWIHNGFYDLETLRKLSFGIEGREVDRLMWVALSNSGGRLGTLVELNSRRAWMADTLLNPTVEPALFRKKSTGELDLTAGTPLNFYENVSLAEAVETSSKFPRNSKLAKRHGDVVELVYRTGDENLAPGPYASQLEQVSECLENARPYLTGNRITTVDSLVLHFGTGDAVAYDAAMRQLRSSDAQVDFILGFNDRRFDPLGQRGLWTGLVFIADDEAQAQIEELIRFSRESISAFPGYDAALFPEFNGKIKAIQLLCAIGNNGPLSPDVYYDHPITEAQQPSQCLIFTNVVSARATARARNLEIGFCESEADTQTCVLQAAQLALVQTALRVAFDPRDAKINEKAKIRSIEEVNNRDVLTQALMELACLWLTADPAITTEWASSDTKTTQEAFQHFGRIYLAAIEETKFAPGIARSKAIRLIGNYLLSAGGAIELRKQDERTICHVLDPVVTRTQIGDLASQVASLLTQNSPKDQKDFIARFGDAREGIGEKTVSRRNKGRGSFAREAFIFPLVQADFNRMGGITDVRLQEPESFSAEMFLYGGWPPPDKKNRDSQSP